MTTISASDFRKCPGLFLEKASREPVDITNHGRRESVLMSAEHYDWLKSAAQRAHRTVDTTDVVLAAVERADFDGP